MDIQFENKSENADSYHWDFGDGTTSTEANPQHHYYHSGNYKVSLRAIKNGTESVHEQYLHVGAPEDCLIEIVTADGIMLARLYDETPKHQKNFLKLVEEGFYDSLLFHRVIPGFMIQGGDPESLHAPKGKALGKGGPGYQIEAEFTIKVHLRGALAAARTNNPEKKSSGSQFYIVDGSPVGDAELDKHAARMGRQYTPAQRKAYKESGGTPFLDGQYTVFGELVEGHDVISKIANAKTDARNRPQKDRWMLIRRVQ